MTLGIPGNNGAQNSSGTLVTFIVYVAAPLIIVLANIFSMMLMVTNKEQQINHQLRILGTNTTQLVATVFYKAFICGIVTVIWGALFNSILYLALYKISLLVRSPAKLNIWSILYFPVASSILSFSFILMIGCYSITKSHHLRE
jgi:ABC-type lipoprotein release transport system permease subunit